MRNQPVSSHLFVRAKVIVSSCLSSKYGAFSELPGWLCSSCHSFWALSHLLQTWEAVVLDFY